MKFFFMTVVILFAQTGFGQQKEFPIYEGSVPNSKENDFKEIKGNWGGDHFYFGNVTKPTLTAFIPDSEIATGTAVIICPGGGYRVVAVDHEGYTVARAFQNIGVAAFVLKYRTPSEKTMHKPAIGPLQDVQRTFQILGEKAREWNIDTSRTGIMGFSAGGHLAASAATHYDKNYLEDSDEVILKPAFMILGYPVISFSEGLTHMGSRNNLLGENPSQDLIDSFSNELLVTPQTPVAFIFHSGNDKTVKVENSIKFYEALNKNGVNSQLLIYPEGGHGYGLDNPSTPSKWFVECKNWMIANGWID
ncbi:alpha/beta hydrolase [Leeuwenhoekiella parthenopeia]|uniref:Alpha/beta hydrolase n=1 Tax=Leeuwenhoekiella parthenopeia TaxID=2890320 RepID=A0ABS8GMM3_9FLAO|nr:alpha/beta hydrolase [Leeuwenhoekiella parthenopeia]MCC4211229.1 alpha/beta hydrolase [Leeuwenhoekiella parthenopeia]